MGAGTHELRPTWGAHPLQRKAPPIMSPCGLDRRDPRVLGAPIPAPSECPTGRSLRSYNPLASIVEMGRLRPSGERDLPRVRERVRGETGTPSLSLTACQVWGLGEGARGEAASSSRWAPGSQTSPSASKIRWMKLTLSSSSSWWDFTGTFMYP